MKDGRRWWRRAADLPVPGPASALGVSAVRGSIAAGGDVVNSSVVFAEHALPAQAYAPIPDDAAARGVSNIPRMDLFVGRGNELDELDAAFAVPGGVVLRTVHGLGGVGKSALAAHWAAHRASAGVRWWISADRRAAVDAGLAGLARALQPGLTELPTETQGERALHWLATHGDWLIVLDDVEHPDHIAALLDRTGTGTGRVLVTTRRTTGWHRNATTIRLGVFEPADSLELFTRILDHQGPRDHDGSDRVCDELGHLALGVEQAAAFCAETGTTPRAYLDMLRDWPARTYAAGAEGVDAERTVARIWHLTLDRLADTPLAADLLRILAWYAPDRIPRDLLDGLAEPPELATAIGRLVAYSMITDNHDDTLTVHRLVQALARTPDPHDPHRRPQAVDHARDRAAARLADTFPTDVDHPGNWPRCRALLPHTDALTRHHTPDHDTAHTAHALDRAAAYQLGQGALVPTIHALRRALTTRERVLGDDHPDTLDSRDNLANAYVSAGDLGRAIALHEHTLKDRQRVLGDDHPNTLMSRSNLANAYMSAGDLGRATRLLERTVNDRERVLSNDHPGTMTSRNNLA
ncbi:tetratricopeptide repeat protein, partial [Embleya sp. NPDC055664]